MDILGIIRRLPEIVAYNKFDDDFFDRLNYSHTVAILTVFAIIVTNRQFSENQIKCWVPAQFTGSYEQYVNQICFITNTYSHEMHEPLTDDLNDRHEHELKYYQWTPFILLLMAISFYIPHQFWRGLSLRSGVDLKDLVEAAQTYRSANVRQEDKMKLLDYLTSWLNSYCSNAYRLITLERNQIFRTRKAKFIRLIHHLVFPIGIYTGNYLIISYLFIKFLYLFNSIGQILLLNTLLGRQFWYYGIEIIRQYWTKQIGLLYSGNEYFPKVVLCDFIVREPNHLKESHRYTVQCVLPFNLFNQQIFTYLYFWLIILSVFNAVSILIWLYRISPYTNFHYLERRLIVHFLTDEHSDEQNLRHIFVYRYLQGDGTFMLRLLAANVSDYVCTKIILELYKKFRTALLNDRIDREALFKLISEEKSEEKKSLNEDDDGSTDQTSDDIPPIPNPRHGKISIERDILPRSSSDTSLNEQHQSRRTVSFSLPTTMNNEQIHLQNSPITLLEDIRRPLNTQMDSTDRSTSRRRSIEFHPEFESTPLSTPPLPLTPSPPPLPPLPPTLTMKGPSPYATTYLTAMKRNEHEVPYIDDSISSSSTSGRSTSAAVVQQSPKPTTILSSTNPLFPRSHDV